MAVMQTPHGRVVGLILPKEDQPKPVAVEKTQEDVPSRAKTGKSLREGATPSVTCGDSSLREGAKAAKPATAKRTGRTARK